MTPGEEEGAKQGKGGQHEQKGRKEDAETSCIYFGLALENSPGDRRQPRTGTHSMRPRRACARPVNVRACGAPREQPPPWRAVRNDRGEANLRTRRTWLEGWLPMTESGGGMGGGEGLLAVRRSPSARRPQTGAASYVTTGVHSTFESMVAAHRRSPTPSSPLSSLCSDAVGLPHGAYLDFPRSSELESGCRPLSFASHRAQDPTAGYLVSVTKPEALHRTARKGVPGWPRR